MVKDQFTEQARRERFLRLATLRTNIILERLRILGHCANKSAYYYNDADIEKIFSAIEEQAKDIKSKFKIRTKRTITLD